VLVPTDLSPVGNQAVAYAHAIAADGGTVHILHVAESADKASIEQLRQLIPEDAPGKRVETRLEVVSDPSVPAAITAAAERLDVDVVCLGTHGRSGLTGVLLGSVAQAVAERCRRQVLLVPPQRAKS
jgi:nucleotide-binding universal stress UspA family protein